MKKILVVDDEIFNCDVIAKILTKEGFLVLEATNGKEALEILRSDNIDLVLMDIMMPVMNGFETIKAIKKENRFDKLPLIAVTALSDDETRREVLRLGVMGCITKPFVLSDLVNSVKEALKNTI